MWDREEESMTKGKNVCKKNGAEDDQRLSWASERQKREREEKIKIYLAVVKYGSYFAIYTHEKKKSMRVHYIQL